MPDIFNIQPYNVLLMKLVKSSNQLLSDLRMLIAETRQYVAWSVNSALLILYWKVGQRIRQDILKGKRAAYGREIVVTLWRQLVEEFGNGFSRSNLFRMVRFADKIARRIVNQVRRGLTSFPSRQFERDGTEELENPYVFNAPNVVKAGGLEALRTLGEPKDIINETKKRLSAV